MLPSSVEAFVGCHTSSSSSMTRSPFIWLHFACSLTCSAPTSQVDVCTASALPHGCVAGTKKPFPCNYPTTFYV